MKTFYRADFIWIDGQSPTAKVRSKPRFSRGPFNEANIPEWGHDGSSTHQALTEHSDCNLKPERCIQNPLREDGNVLVLCEVMMPDGTPHPSNTRAHLRILAERFKKLEPWFGVEQEYTLFDLNGIRPLGWPNGHGYPAPQGRYYCGVGSDEVYGRKLADAHSDACLRAGIELFGTNAEVMPGQWEFQMMPLPPLDMCDQMWLARWLLYRLGEDFDITVKLHPKPMQAGDWNGAGAHTNFSTKEMREDGGLEYITRACERLGEYHKMHMVDHVYGEDNALRLTGKHETCDINTFRFGIGDRGASVRIPARVSVDGKGYLEDRRPAANMDPYRVCSAILETVCGNGFDPDVFSYFKVKRGDAHR